MLDHVVLQVLSRAVLSSTQVAGFSGSSSVQLLVLGQHAPVEESFVTIITSEPGRQLCCGAKRRSTSSSPHTKLVRLTSRELIVELMRLSCVCVAAVVVEEVFKVVVVDYQVVAVVAVITRLHDVLLLHHVSVREHIEDHGLDVSDGVVWHHDGLLHGTVEHGDGGELREEEAEHQLVVGDDAVLTHEDRVHEHILVDAAADAGLDRLHLPLPLQLVQLRAHDPGDISLIL